MSKELDRLRARVEPALAQWLATNPRVFADAVVLVIDSVTDTRVYTATVEKTLMDLSQRLRPEMFEDVRRQVRARAAPTVAPVIMITTGGALFVSSIDWGTALSRDGLSLPETLPA